MKNQNDISTDILAAIALIAATPDAAFAYMDAGTFSYFIQIVVASLLGVSVAVRVYWGRIKSIFMRNAKARRDEEKSGDRGGRDAKPDGNE